MFITNDALSNILDTVRIDATGIYLKPYHALRTYEAFQFIDKAVNLETVVLQYDAIEKQILSAGIRNEIVRNEMVRIVFSYRDFSYQYQLLPVDPLPPSVPLQLVTEIQQKSGLGAQNYKWEERSYWDKLMSFKAKSAFDVISVNEKNEVVETSRFNLFFYDKKNNVVKTPGLMSGCINGVYRRFIFQEGVIELPGVGKKQVVEDIIYVADISLFQLFVTNSVRGVLSAEVVK